MENEIEIRRYKIIEKTRRMAKISERYSPADKRSSKCVPTSCPKQRKVEIIKCALKAAVQYKRTTNQIQTKNPRSLKYIMRDLQISDNDRLNQVMTSDETITVVSNGGLKNYGGFGWVAAVEDKVIMKCCREVKGSKDQSSSF